MNDGERDTRLIETLKWYAFRHSGIRARRVLLQTGIAAICDQCLRPASAEEIARNNSDPSWLKLLPQFWTCMECEPDLKDAVSGLNWGVVDVGGSSPEHEYGGKTP